MATLAGAIFLAVNLLNLLMSVFTYLVNATLFVNYFIKNQTNINFIY